MHIIMAIVMNIELERERSLKEQELNNNVTSGHFRYNSPKKRPRRVLGLMETGLEMGGRILFIVPFKYLFVEYLE